MIILEKAREEEMLSENIADTIISVKKALTSRLIDLVEWYKWVMSNTDLDVTKELGLTSIKK